MNNAKELSQQSAYALRDMPAEHYTYMLECSDGTFYTGYTTDIDRRVTEHNNGNGAKYTTGRTPVRLVYQEAHETKSAAMSREHEIKSYSRSQKEALITANNAESDSSV